MGLQLGLQMNTQASVNSQAAAHSQRMRHAAVPSLASEERLVVNRVKQPSSGRWTDRAGGYRGTITAEEVAMLEREFDLATRHVAVPFSRCIIKPVANRFGQVQGGMCSSDRWPGRAGGCRSRPGAGAPEPSYRKCRCFGPLEPILLSRKPKVTTHTLFLKRLTLLLFVFQSSR